VPTIRKRTNLLTGESANALSGDQFEFLPFNAGVEFAIISDLVDVEATVYSGSDVLMEQAPVSVQSTPPRYPDDFLLQDVAAAGDRLSVKLQNNNAGAVVVDTVVKITPL
jgi:hypothetical protein